MLRKKGLWRRYVVKFEAWWKLNNKKHKVYKFKIEIDQSNLNFNPKLRWFVS